MKCDEIQARLTSYLDLEIPVEERQAVKDHLGICSVCSEELNELKKVGQWVHLVQSESDPYFENQVLRWVRSARKGSRKGNFWVLNGWNFFRLTGVKRVTMASVFVLSILTAYYLGYQSHPYWMARSVGVSPNDLEKINQEIDFYKDYEMIHQMDLLKKMDGKSEQPRGENL